MTKPCPKCGTEQEIMAVDSAGVEIVGPCQVCHNNWRQKHQGAKPEPAAKTVDGK